MATESYYLTPLIFFVGLFERKGSPNKSTTIPRLKENIRRTIAETELYLCKGIVENFAGCISYLTVEFVLNDTSNKIRIFPYFVFYSENKFLKFQLDHFSYRSVQSVLHLLLVMISPTSRYQTTNGDKSEVKQAAVNK